VPWWRTQSDKVVRSNVRARDAPSSSRPLNPHEEATKREERRATEDWTNETPPVSYLPPTCTHASIHRRPRLCKSEQEEKRWRGGSEMRSFPSAHRVIHLRAAPLGCQATAAMTSSRPTRLSIAQTDDVSGADDDVQSHFASHLSTRFKWTCRGIGLPCLQSSNFHAWRRKSRAFNFKLVSWWYRYVIYNRTL